MTVPNNSPLWTTISNEEFGAVAVVEATTQAMIADLTGTSGDFAERLERAYQISATPELVSAAEDLMPLLFDLQVNIHTLLAIYRLDRALRKARNE